MKVNLCQNWFCVDTTECPSESEDISKVGDRGGRRRRQGAVDGGREMDGGERRKRRHIAISDELARSPLVASSSGQPDLDLEARLG